MKKTIFLLHLLVFSFSIAAFSQTDEEKVEAVIESLFDGMRAKNAEQVAAAFSPEAIMQTIAAKPEGTTVASSSVGDFAKRIGSTPAETQLDERILEYQIKVDGALASVWTPYRFYLNGNFSHCGVNSFQLVKMAEGWKIVYIIDTRRKEPCEE
ncbi:nuclear transport factor 2 family protein [Algoriphagus aestuariicola]|jgi:ketosteroid isomerase-like protein|uniref:Nuclear transport factor 2 family protein n=1 Tax=Algoriphagus aestuariicola TaxID=1852016 RepID=A0ABS3BUL0_9BACT|nr:nuclear transport factor 2 family protein [Algoriphagus aestuariicola]MBN7802808.1 nuclear transport factor 2 family protein [Algoriphagus aestuariicola]